MPTTSLQVDRFVLAAAVVLTCVLFTAQAADPVNVIKLTAMVFCALALAVSAAYRALRHRVVQLPVGPAAWVALALTLAFGVSTLAAPVTTTAVVGAYGRNSGLIAYLAAVVLLVGALRVVTRTTAAPVLGGVVLAGLFTASYGLLQKAGIDAIPWNNPFNPIIAALGNPNFASGYLGIAASVSAGAALWAGWGTPWRAISGVTCLACLSTAALSASVQGPIAAAAGLFVVGLTVILGSRSTVRRRGLVAAAALAATGTGVLLAGAVAKVGPATPIFTDNGSRARVYYWEAALAMFQDRPLVGIGLDQYGNFWRSARSPESVGFLGGPSYSDAAHSVPLQFLAQGGLLMGLVYAGFLGLTAWALVRGMLRLEGSDRLLLGAVGGGWAAYQVQSFVSIDQVPLIVLHFVLAGAVLAVSGVARLREVRLPGAPEPARAHPNDARTRRRVSAAPVTRSLSGADATALAAVVAAVLVLAWLSTVPLRANMALQQGDERLSTGDGNGALENYQRATGLLPGQSFYWNKTGNLFDQVQRPAQAREAYAAGAERDPYDVNSIKAAAARAEQEGDLDVARRLFQRAVELDPLNSETLVPAATFELRHAGAAAARDLLERAVRDLPADAALWATLGDARTVLGDTPGGREAYERAVQLDPAQATALAGLERLRAGSA